MFRFKATAKWYQDAALQEGDYEISAGPEIFPFTIRSQNGGGSVGGSGQIGGHDQQDTDILQVGFRTVMRKLRMKSGLSLSELADKTDIELEQLLLIEQKIGYKPPPRTIHQLAKFYEIPAPALMQLVGGQKKIDPSIKSDVIRFAAESESFETLSKEEKKMLDQLVRTLRDTKLKH